MSKREEALKAISMSKRDEVLKAISPIMKVFGIEDYDYEVNSIKETLRIYDTRIGCTANSIDAIIDEVIGYLFINRWCRYRSLGTFSTQAKNVIKRYWEKD